MGRDEPLQDTVQATHHLRPNQSFCISLKGIYFFHCHKSRGVLKQFLTLEVRSKRAYRLKLFCTNLNHFEQEAQVPEDIFACVCYFTC